MPLLSGRKPLSVALTFIIFFLLLSTAACSGGRVAQAPAEGRFPVPKYIFLFIGDGMGPAQVGLAGAVLDSSSTLAMTGFPVLGTVTTHAENRYITDSGAAGTALATGSKTSVGTISMKSNHRDTLRTVAELARRNGMRVGIVSSVGIDNATPACFFAHNAKRSNYYDIAGQMAESGFDYFGGGYAEGDFPRNRLKGGVNRPDIPALMKIAGYRVVSDRSSLRSVLPGTKCWAYTDYDGKAAMSFEMERKEQELSLAEFTREGIRLLDNPKGFFMMVEGGKIDWACHANDGAAAAHDVVAFDDAIREAVAFSCSHPDETLIVVTADHECGGLSLGNGRRGYDSRMSLLRRQKVSLEGFSRKVTKWKESRKVSFSMALDSVKVYYGLGDVSADSSLALSGEERLVLSKAYSNVPETGAAASGSAAEFASAVTGILNERAGVGWTSKAHTAVPVQVFAAGAGAEAFSGYYDNIGIAGKIIRLARFGERR
jgi:alkaline phosphatase